MPAADTLAGNTGSEALSQVRAAHAAAMGRLAYRLCGNASDVDDGLAGTALDIRSDIFCIGGCLSTFMTGRRPYSGSTIMEILRAIS